MVRFQKTLNVSTAFVHPDAIINTFDRTESNASTAHTTRKFTRVNWFWGIVLSTRVIFVLLTFTRRPFDHKLICYSRIFANNSPCVSAMMTSIHTKEFPRITSPANVWHCFQDKIGKSGLRSLIFSNLNIKPRTILAFDSYIRFCFCVHSLNSSNKLFTNTKFPHSSP